MDELPPVLLGIRTTWREDPSCSTSDLMYSTSLCIPGEFLLHEPWNVQASSEFLRQLQENMHSVLPPAQEHHGGYSAYKPNTLASTGYVYVRHDAPRGPLQHSYDGPFKVLEVHNKDYVLDVNDRQDSVSIDWLKVAFGKQADCQPAPTPPLVSPSLHPLRAAPSRLTSSEPPPVVYACSGKQIQRPFRYQ